jgi:hypothetical protein
LSYKVSLADPEDIEEYVVDLAFALQLVPQGCLLLLPRKLGEPTDVFRPYLIGDDGESFQRPLVLRRKLKAAIKHSSSAVYVVGAKAKVVPGDSFQGERDKTML